MKIAIDFSSSLDGGALTYLLNFPHALAKVDLENEYYLIGASEQFNVLKDVGTNFTYLQIPYPGSSAYIRTAWQQFRLPILLHQLNIDLLYSTVNTTTFFAPCKVVLALRGHQVFTVPEFFITSFRSRFRLTLRRLLMKASIYKADKIITVSEKTKQELSSVLEIPSQKLKVVYHGISSCLKPSPPSTELLKTWKDKYGLIGPYILTISSFYRWKNYGNLIKAYHLLKTKHKVNNKLVIIGTAQQRDYFAEISTLVDDLGLDQDIVLISGLPHEELPSWYSGADVYVFPSVYETFGFTQLEAMACGTPVAVSKISVMPEISGDATLYFDPNDPADIAQTIYRILDDERLRQQLIQRGLERSRQFTWERTANEMVSVFKSFL